LYFFSVTRIRDARTSRGRLIVLLQSRRRPFTVLPTSLHPTSWHGQQGMPRPSDFGIVFLRRRLIMHTALCSWSTLPLNSFILCSLHRHFNESGFHLRGLSPPTF